MLFMRTQDKFESLIVIVSLWAPKTLETLWAKIVLPIKFHLIFYLNLCVCEIVSVFSCYCTFENLWSPQLPQNIIYVKRCISLMSVTFVTFLVLFVMYIFCHITVLMRSCSQQVCVCVYKCRYYKCVSVTVIISLWGPKILLGTKNPSPYKEMCGRSCNGDQFI